MGWVRRTILGAILTIVLLAAAGYAARRSLLVAVGRFLVVQDPPAPAQAIVVLSGSLPDRILEAVDLYQAHLAPRIILTQEGLPPGLRVLRRRGGNMMERHEVNQDIARQLGVPPEAMELVTAPAWSTLTEAETVIDYLRRHGITSILLVTSPPHSRRAAMTYRHLAGDTLQIRMCPSHYDYFVAERWFESRPLARRLLIEYLKLLNYVLVDRWCATTRAAPSG
jgi:uncharacterized SAM-binding protein YcdF (DUF218 family)